MLDNSLPPYCPLCKGAMPISALNHKYGDYVILRPTEESCQKLTQLGMVVSSVFTQELPNLDFSLGSHDAMHLTLAMPLKALSKTQARALINAVKGTGPIQFDLIFRGSNSGGNYDFSFGSRNYAPQFNVRLRENTTSYNNHNSNGGYGTMTGVAQTVQGFCTTNKLVDRTRNADGQCNTFSPHITLGCVSADSDCITLHDRAVHYDKSSQKPLSHLQAEKAATVFACNAREHKHCNVLQLKFDKIEILRFDSLGDQSTTTCLESLDLTTNDVTEGVFSGCSHKAILP